MTALWLLVTTLIVTSTGCEDTMARGYVVLPDPVRGPVASTADRMKASRLGSVVHERPVAPLSWGRQHTFSAPWTKDGRRSLLTLDAEPKVPRVRTAILGIEYPITATGQCCLRWSIVTGVGGASAEWIIDAVRLQQVSLPANSLTISLMVTAPGENTLFSEPTDPVKASAFIADGSTSTDCPVYSALFVVGAGASLTLTPPNGSSKYRIEGYTASAVTPFLAVTLYQLNALYGTTSVYTGAELAAIRPQWIPATGQQKSLTVNNTANGADVAGTIQWGIDL